MKKIAILQSNYIPWKGYFDFINSVDEFILYDCVQYTKNDWRNRNKIKTINGLQWLTIPVHADLNTKIKDVEVINNIWRKKHWKALVSNYSKSKFFNTYSDVFEEIYLNNQDSNLSKINYLFIKKINKILNIKTKILFSENFYFSGTKTEPLIDICKQCNANIYLSGPAAKCYLDKDLFERENIKIEWMDYSGYKKYEQLHGDFEHGVSILDLIFNVGPNYKDYMISFGEKK